MFNNHVPAGDITEREEPWILVALKDRAPLQSLPPSSTSRNRYKALAAIDVPDSQDYMKKSPPAACSGYCKNKCGVLVVGKFLLKGTDTSLCWLDRES